MSTSTPTTNQGTIPPSSPGEPMSLLAFLTELWVRVMGESTDVRHSGRSAHNKNDGLPVVVGENPSLYPSPSIFSSPSQRP